MRVSWALALESVSKSWHHEGEGGFFFVLFIHVLV